MTTSLRVLVCEENADQRAVLADTLRERGHVVSETATGTDALTCAMETSIDVAFIDTNLPDMTGFDVGRLMRDVCLSQRVRMIALAEHQSTDQIGALRSASFDMILVKPVKLEQLVAALSLVRRLM